MQICELFCIHVTFHNLYFVLFDHLAREFELCIVLSSCIQLLFFVLLDIYLAQQFSVRGQKHSFFYM